MNKTTFFENIPTEVTDKASARITIPDYNYEWYIIKADKCTNGDYDCYGFVNFISPEYGYFSFDELMSMGAEIDTEWEPRPMSIVATEIIEKYCREE